MRLIKTLVIGVVAGTCLAQAPASAASPGPGGQHGNSPKAGKPSTPAPPPATTTTSPTINPIAAKIQSHPQLNTKIMNMLPAGMSLNQASMEFKNQGQFIAALHVSQNLGIPFAALKTDMTTNHMSLGQSIQKERHTSTTTATTEAKKAEHEADDDVKKTPPPPHSSSVSNRISSNPRLLAKVQVLLPTGTTLKDDAKGFTNESQFIAALHASKDLGIPFAQIKAEMTGGDHDSLTQAIHELKPSVDAAAAAKTARAEATADITSTATTAAHGDHDGNAQ